MDEFKHIRCSEKEAARVIDEIAENPYKRIFIEQTEDGMRHFAKIEDATWACVLCDQFDPWEQDPAGRCTKGHDCLAADEKCPSRTTDEADELYGEVDNQEHFWLDLNALKPNKAIEKTVEEAHEDHEIALLHADLCLSDPEAYGIEEKAAICKELQESRFALYESMKREIQAWPPEFRESFIRRAADDVYDEVWWRRFLME